MSNTTQVVESDVHYVSSPRAGDKLPDAKEVESRVFEHWSDADIDDNKPITSLRHVPWPH